MLGRTTQTTAQVAPVPTGAPEPRSPPLDAASIVAEAAGSGLVLAPSFSEPTLAAEATLGLGRTAAGSGMAIIWKSNGFSTPEAVALLAP